MSKVRSFAGLALSLLIAVPPGALASSHREAPITALDHAADITDFYAFVSYDHPDRVTFVLNVDPFLQPSNGPNYFPFDPSIVYQIKIDNNHDAVPDVTFQFRFQTTIRDPQLFTGFAGAGAGIDAPANSPAPVPPGTPIIPPAITSLTGPGSAGLSLEQTFAVNMLKGDHNIALKNKTGSPLIAVPSNVGPRTMPDYDALAAQGIYNLQGTDASDIKVFAGTVADPFFIDLGAAFDSFNFRAAAGGGVLTKLQDANDQLNTAPNSVAGFNVNTIVIEVPICLLTSDGAQHKSTDPKAVIGAWATTSRSEMTIRPPHTPAENSGRLAQVQRLGNPLINELIIGTGSKDYWSMSHPLDDSQFAAFDLDPLLARVFNAVFGINIPAPPRTDLLPLVTYAAPIAPPDTPAGPIADLLRLNTGVAPTPLVSRRRLGLLDGDAAGFPNGRRLTDDVVDIAARVVAGGVLSPGFNVAPNNLLGDGVNAPDVPPQETFPYVHYAYSGRDSRHISPGDPTGCGDQPPSSSSQNSDAPPANQGGPAPCPVN
ncbi:hypothetical protein ACPOL_2376 [Acidisarcina polymorpha]|uniref:DUF4331 domain-containing protein n=1 Tax=Acidisarcina polymorpha TaxID=2211140 RepID=A0A2Z5FXU4_9BACT|nr:DUF4331 domain-containing protein [Acidisarcina polymorpha]AXC11698.1 hypothetical protein ACPOL_2376 [Acidisarcina polymorpha]